MKTKEKLGNVRYSRNLSDVKKCFIATKLGLKISRQQSLGRSTRWSRSTIDISGDQEFSIVWSSTQIGKGIADGFLSRNLLKLGVITPKNASEKHRNYPI